MSWGYPLDYNILSGSYPSASSTHVHWQGLQWPILRVSLFFVTESAFTWLNYMQNKEGWRGQVFGAARPDCFIGRQDECDAYVVDIEPRRLYLWSSHPTKLA